MKTKEEILKQNNVSGQDSNLQECYEDILNSMQQYSDQNTKPLVDCLKEVKRIEDLKLFNESEKLEAIKQAVDLTLSQYDKEKPSEQSP